MENSMDLETKLISLISELLFLTNTKYYSLWQFWLNDLKARSLITQIISMVSLMDLNSQPKPESELMSLITQSLSVFNSLDLDSLSTPVSKFISELSREIYMDSDSDEGSSESDLEFIFDRILYLEPEPEYLSLIHKICSLVISMNSKSRKFISLRPQAGVRLENGKFHVGRYPRSSKWRCLPGNWLKIKSKGEYAIFFCCQCCDGKNHEEYKQAPVKIKHHLHRKHSLQLVLFMNYLYKTRECYCCDEDLLEVFYYCPACDFAMNIACARKPPVLSIDHPEWHEHTLALFPRHASLNCNLCGLADESSPIYMCPPCDCVVHQKCINLPCLIRISRHPHRLSFTPSFEKEDLSCGVCRRKIDNNYGGYSCIKDGCSYAAHSKCATQKNVWDGNELEGEPEEDVEEVAPFVKISDGIIQHFSHQHHYLRLDDNMDRDYNEDDVCQACITPVYFGNFYSCMQCDFILHEECANLSRGIYHPIHPHLLTLCVVEDSFTCRACNLYCIAGFSYVCEKKGCNFKLNVQCAIISEPLVNESHMHPLFLTSKPEEERRRCLVCNKYCETFNCIECDFVLCFKCATLPQKVRYKHDKHTLTLSYGDETSTTTYWCEVCEGKVDPKGRFYVCDEYCCVTLHIECLLGQDLYMKSGSSWFAFEKSEKKVHVLPNNHHLTRPFCSYCEKRCPHKIAFKWSESILCSLYCVFFHGGD